MITHGLPLGAPVGAHLIAGHSTVVRDITTTCRFLALLLPSDSPPRSGPDLQLQTWQETPITTSGEPGTPASDPSTVPTSAATTSSTLNSNSPRSDT